MPDVGYLVLDESQTTEQEVPTNLREVIEDDLGRHSPLPEPARGRWLIADGMISSKHTPCLLYTSDAADELRSV